MSSLILVVDAVAVLRPVDDAHVVVSHSTVFWPYSYNGAAAVLHLLARGAGVGLGDHWAGFGAARSRGASRSDDV